MSKKKNIWILNHYATSMYSQRLGRHYGFAEKLIENGYRTTIFCASTFHNSDEEIRIPDGNFTIEKGGGVPFVFVKTSAYKSNGISRMKNIWSFYKNLFSVVKKDVKKNPKPDLIVASSVHPLTLVAGIQISKKFNIPCICEVRDLWPESLVAYGVLNKKNPITKLMYVGEKLIYTKADHLIMTWPGGSQYIKEKGWDKKIKMQNVHHISNGIMLSHFDENSKLYEHNDKDIDNLKVKNFVYTGAIRKVNNLGLLLDAAKYIQESGIKDIRILIYGSGDELDHLKNRCKLENINIVKFKGKVERKYIPSILKKAYVNILHNSSSQLDKYGQSQNKLFEYMASGKCILQTYYTNFNIIEKNSCGYTISDQNAKKIADKMIEAKDNKGHVIQMGKKARQASSEYDYDLLTKKLINLIENI